MGAIDSILNNREEQYGEFADVADTAIRIYDAVTLNPDKFTNSQLVALQAIASKLGRIAHGNAQQWDSWADIAGYATLIAKELE